jgi:hypothetical protein
LVELRNTKSSVIFAIDELLIDWDVTNGVVGGLPSIEGVKLIGGGIGD